MHEIEEENSFGEAKLQLYKAGSRFVNWKKLERCSLFNVKTKMNFFRNFFVFERTLVSNKNRI